jgi:hypoxia up-regulated 1
MCRKLEAPIIVRFTESQTRGKAIDDFQQAMFAARAFFVEAHANSTAGTTADAASPAPEETPSIPGDETGSAKVEPAVLGPRYTEEELKVVEDMLKDNEQWMDGLMEVQVQLESDKTSDPVIFTKDLNERGKKLQMTVSDASI